MAASAARFEITGGGTVERFALTYASFADPREGHVVGLSKGAVQ